MKSNYDIFISYRREGGFDTAKHLFDLLIHDGYKVSFDIDTLRNGYFDTTLLERIDECKDFILIVDAHAFDRTIDPHFDPSKDWLRQELSYALTKKKNIIPVFLSGISCFPGNLPNDVKDVTRINGPEYNRYYFNDFYNRLKTDFIISKSHKIPISKILINTTLFLGLLIIIFGVIYYRNHTTNSKTSLSSDTEIIATTPQHSEAETAKPRDEIASLVEEFNHQIQEHNNAWWTLFSDNNFLSALSTTTEDIPQTDYFYNEFSEMMSYKGKLKIASKPFSLTKTGASVPITVNLYGANVGPSLFSITCESALNPEIDPDSIASMLGFNEPIKELEVHDLGYDKTISKKGDIYLCVVNNYGSGGYFPSLYFSTSLEDFEDL